jgi:tetratricopeptide (TPR) repeat protein
MKFLLGVLLLTMIPTDPGKIGEINSVKTEAREAYAAGNYKKAIEKYRYLSDSLQVAEDEVTLNLGNAYFQVNDTANASAAYQSLLGSTKPVVRSKAHQQMGILNHKQGKLKEALNNFKQAIKADPNNIDARYNYEMLKKKLDEQNKQEQNQQNKDDQNKDQQKKDQQEKQDQQNKDQQQKDQQQKDQEQKDQEQKEKEQKEKEQQQKDQQSKEEKDKEGQEKEKRDQEQKERDEQQKKENAQQLSEKLEQMKISEEKAKMILEAMKNQEIQYLQQNKRKATKSRDKSKPDW